MLLESVRFKKRVVDSHLHPDEDEPKSEVCKLSLAVVEAGFQLELESEVSASDRVELGGAFGLLESFPKSASVEPTG